MNFKKRHIWLKMMPVLLYLVNVLINHCWFSKWSFHEKEQAINITIIYESSQPNWFKSKGGPSLVKMHASALKSYCQTSVYIATLIVILFETQFINHINQWTDADKRVRPTGKALPFLRNVKITANVVNVKHWSWKLLLRIIAMSPWSNSFTAMTSGRCR